MIEVELTRDELLHATHGGAQRQLDALLLRRGSHFEHVDSWMNHIHGAMAEMAVARPYGRYWFPCYDDPIAVPADVGRNWQVRAIVKPGAALILRERDLRLHPTHAFILVHVEIPKFRLIGWIRCQDGIRGEWEVPPNGDKPKAWFVPQAALQPIGEPQVAAVAA